MLWIFDKYHMNLIDQIKNSITDDTDPLNFFEPVVYFEDNNTPDSVLKEYWSLVTYYWYCGERLAFEIYRDFLPESNLGYYTDEELVHLKQDEAKHLKISRSIHSAIAGELPDGYFYESFLENFSKESVMDIKKIIAIVTFTELYAQVLIDTWRKFGSNTVINNLFTEILDDEYTHFEMSSRIFNKLLEESTTKEKIEMFSSIKSMGYQNSLFSMAILELAKKYPKIKPITMCGSQHDEYFVQSWAKVVTTLLGEKLYNLAFLN